MFFGITKMLDLKFLANFYKYKRKLNFCIKSATTNHRKFSTRSQSDEGKIKKPKILFFGTDNFSLPSLKELHKQSSSIGFGTVTSFKSPANCVRTYAEQQQIPLYRWPITPEICRNYDLGVVVSFGHLIPENIINSFPLGMINVHASLLPRWRGAAPIIYAIMHGDTETGVSIMRVEPKRFDVGDIFAQKRVPISANTFMPELHQRLANDGASLLVNVINGYPESFQRTTKQNNDYATFAPKITPAITEVHWFSMNSTDVYNRYRALYSFKHLSTQFLEKSIQLVEIQLPTDTIDKSNASLVPGTFSYKRDRKCLRVCCANNSFIEVLKLRIEGKKVMSALEFNNGFLKKLSPNQLLFTNK